MYERYEKVNLTDAMWLYSDKPDSLADVLNSKPNTEI